MTTDQYILVIGYGNELRTDDGLGPKLAAAVGEWRLPGVQSVTCHQLMPELADPISAAGAVVFFDAAVGEPEEVQVRLLSPRGALQPTAHSGDPCALLALAQAVFGRCPPAWWITVPAFDLRIGTELSARAKEAAAVALQAFRQLWTPPNCSSRGDEAHLFDSSGAGSKRSEPRHLGCYRFLAHKRGVLRAERLTRIPTNPTLDQ